MPIRASDTAYYTLYDISTYPRVVDFPTTHEGCRNCRFLVAGMVDAEFILCHRNVKTWVIDVAAQKWGFCHYSLWSSDESIYVAYHEDGRGYDKIYVTYDREAGSIKSEGLQIYVSGRPTGISKTIAPVRVEDASLLPRDELCMVII